MELEKILQKSGYLELKKHIEVNCGGVIRSNEAVRLLYYLNKEVIENDSLFTPEHLFEVIVLCCSNIEKMNAKETDAFLLAIYQFIKYFFKQKKFDIIIYLCNYVKQYCIDKEIKTDMYGYFCQFFTKEIFARSKRFEPNLLHETIIFAIKGEALLLKPDLQALFGRIVTFPTLFKYSYINNAQRNKFCMQYLELINTHKIFQNEEYMYDIYKALLNIFYVTINNVSSCNSDSFPNFINNTLEEIFNTMIKFCKNKKFASCIEIWVLLYKSIIKDIRKYNDKSLLNLTECNKKIRGLLRSYGYHPIITLTCNYIGKVLKIMFDYFVKVKDLWKEHFSNVLSLEILRCYELIGTILSKNPNDVEKCCSENPLKFDIFNSISVTSVAVELVNLFVRKNGISSSEMHQIASRILKDCCRNIYELKQHNCEKYIVIWKFVGLQMYNLSVALYKIKDYENSKIYTRIFVDYLFKIEDNTNKDACFKDSLGAALHLHATNLQCLNEKKDALFYLTLTILLSNDYKKKAMWTWVMIKSDQSDDEIKAITVNNILFGQQDEIKNIFPNYIYDQTIAEELLLFELKYYVENWSSRIPVTTCCNEICNISKNILNKTIAYVLSWDKFLVLFDIKIITELESFINSIKITDKLTKLCLSALQFILYQFKMNDLILKNLDDMNKAFIPLKSAPLQPYEEPPNPNDKCDIVPAFQNIKIDYLLNLYEILDECLQLWSSSFETKLSETELQYATELKINKLMKLTAFEYRLHHFQSQMIKTWILSYKLSELLDDKLAILESIGFIIEFSNCKSKEIKDIQKIADKIIKELDKTNSKDMNCISAYYINLSTGYLKNDLLTEAYEALCNAERYFEANPELDKLCEARILYLKTNFLIVPCTFEILSHDENILMIAQSAYNLIAELYKTNANKCSYITSLILEISLSNGWLYKYLRLPREVRCYSKESIILAQKCVLPIRTAQFLSLLAFTDLLDRQYLDCEVKLCGLMKILCYASNVKQEKLTKIPKKVKTNQKEIKPEILSDTDSFNPLFQTVLDVPAPRPQRVTCNELGSPTLRKKPFITPEFVSHCNDCNCYMCRNYEYQKLILDIVHLEAISNMYQDDKNHAEDFFKGGLILYKKLQRKISSFNPIKFSDENEIIFTRLFKNITNNYFTFLLDYSYFLIYKSDFISAAEVLDKVIINDNLKYMNILFWNEVMLQKMNLIIYKEKSLSIEATAENLLDKDNELQVKVETIMSTTPENKISKTKIAIYVSPRLKQKKTKPLKKLMFNLSESETEVDKDTEKQLTPETYYKIKTPGKTPGPLPRIKIYSPQTVKQSKRTRSTIKTTQTETVKSENKIVNKQLEERTKLLTEKLKAEKKPVLKEMNRLETNKSHGNKLRKNLIDELTDVTDSMDKLSVKTTQVVEKKKYTRIKLNYSSSSTSSDGTDKDIKKNKNDKVLGSRIKKLNNTTESVGTRKGVRAKNKK